MFSGKFSRVLAMAVLGLCLLTVSCGKKETPHDVNLLKNPSFEEVEDDLPKHWELVNFHGLAGEQEIEYGIDKSTAVEGRNSWRFRADPGTRRFYVLSQEVEVDNPSHIRLKGWIKLEDVQRRRDQYAQCNFLLTFFDQNHARFQVMRFADKRTRLRFGTELWREEDSVFRVPDGTRYVAVSCVLGMDGRAWFDDVSLSIPKPLDWQTESTKNYVFHWLRERPFPPGAIQNQQRMFDQFAARLGVESDVVVKYYLYPDTATIRDLLSLKGYQYISWDDQEYHTINPNDNHELIHFITDPYGTPTRAISEGTVFWLYDNWQGTPVHEVAADLLSRGQLPRIADLTTYSDFALMDYNQSVPAAASFIKFIVDGWGVERLMELYRTASGANSYAAFAAAFNKVYETPCEDVEEQWRLSLNKIKRGGEQKKEPGR